MASDGICECAEHALCEAAPNLAAVSAADGLLSARSEPWMTCETVVTAVTVVFFVGVLVCSLAIETPLRRAWRIWRACSCRGSVSF